MQYDTYFLTNEGLVPEDSVLGKWNSESFCQICTVKRLHGLGC